MTDKALTQEIANTMRAIDDLSIAAKNVGDDALMFAANRAWNQLSRILTDRTRAQPEKC